MLGSPCLSLARHVKVWIYCVVFFEAYASSKFSLFMTQEQIKTSLNLDFGAKIYLINEGEIASLLKNSIGFSSLIKPLSSSVNEAHFTWQSGQSVLVYNISTESSDELIVPEPTISIQKKGQIPRYGTAFIVSFPCTGKKGGLVDLKFSLSYHDHKAASSPDHFNLSVKKICSVKENTDKSPQADNGSTVKRDVIIAVVATGALLLCFSVCIGLYYRYYKKTRKLQMKFDAEYELASQGELKDVVIGQHDLLNHVYDEEDDAPKRPIFNPKKKQSKTKKWKSMSRHRRGLRLPVAGNATPSYTTSPSTPSSPDSLIRPLENIPEEIEEVKEDADEGDDEHRPMLNEKNAPEHHIVTVDATGVKSKQRTCPNKDSNKRLKDSSKNSCEIILNDDDAMKHKGSSNSDEPDDLYRVLNAHWNQQFHGYLLDINQVSVDSRPFSKGAYGYIHKGKARGTCQHDKIVPVAVKMIKDSMEFDTISSFVSEGLIMSRFKHKNILRLFGVVIQPCAPPMMVMPYMKHGDLNQFLRNARATPRKPQLLSTRQLVNFGLQIARGMEYLSGMRYVHRDLATRNCMVSEELEIKIADFGLAKEIGHDDSYVMAKKMKLPIKWMAIESLNGVFSEKSDVWSFGVVLWELMTLGKQPYSGIESSDMEQHLTRGNRLPPPKSCPEEMYTIMRLCWREDPSERPDFSGLCTKITTYESKYKKYSLDYTLPSSSCPT